MTRRGRSRRGGDDGDYEVFEYPYLSTEQAATPLALSTGTVRRAAEHWKRSEKRDDEWRIHFVDMVAKKVDLAPTPQDRQRILMDLAEYLQGQHWL